MPSSSKATSRHPRCPNKRASNGGCDIPANPTLSATETEIYWLASLDTGSVVLASVPPALLADDGGNTIEPTPKPLAAEDGTHLLRELGHGEQLHLVLPPDAAPTRPLAALIPLGRDGFGRTEAVMRLLAALHGRVVPPDTRLTRQQRARARRMLQAADGARDGATQQEIAGAIFRIGKLARDEWQAASARHAVASLLRDARAMIAGGYRRLLRHRRRP